MRYQKGRTRERIDSDPRSLDNRKEHKTIPTDPGLKPYQRRQLIMKACGCRLCSWVILPFPTTFKEYNRLMGKT